MLAIKELLGRLDQVRQSGPSQWSARCPAHDDRSPSLSIGVGDGGAVLLHCHAGCSFEQVTEALGVAPGDLGSMHARGVDGLRSGSPVVGKSGRVYSDRESASKAAADLVRRQPGHSEWRVVKAYEYVGRDQHPTLVVLRFEPPQGGDKTFRPIHLTDLGWRLGLPQGRLPLYRWQDLPATGTVYVVEGEGVVDCAWDLGLPAVTSQGGASAARKSDWTQLGGRRVVILPDADEPGQRYAEDVARELRRGVSAGFVSIVNLPELPRGGDLVDYVAAQRERGQDQAAIRDGIMSYVRAAEPSHADLADVPDYVPFPVDALGRTFVSFVSRASDALGCDAAMVALPLLVSAASVIGNAREIRIKAAWKEPPILWTAVVAESGSLKSPALELGVSPLRAVEQLLAEEDRRSDNQSRSGEEAVLDVWPPGGAAGAAWSEGGAPRRIKRARSRRLSIADATVEAVIEQMALNQRGLVLIRDELGAWFESLRRYSASAIGDASRWMEMFRAGRVTVDRKTGPRKHIDVPRAALCIIGTIQPPTLRRVLVGQHEEDGLAARFLYVMPPQRQKRWTDCDLDPETRDMAIDIMCKLAELTPQREGDHYISPVTVTFTREAKDRWVQFYDELNVRLAESSGLLSALLAKLEAYVARVALVLHCARIASCELPASEEMWVDRETLERAIAIGEWAEHGARRIVAHLNASDAQLALWRRYEAIRRFGGRTTVREWRRRRSLPTSDDARRELAALVEAGLARWETRDPGTVGRPAEGLILLGDRRS